MTQVFLAMQSRNRKTGPIPVSTTEAATCPTSCPLNTTNAGGCYAAAGPLGMFWQKVSKHTAGGPWAQFLREVAAIPAGTLWRHNQAGDLPGEGDAIDTKALSDLVKANTGRRGFTYTHKPIDRASNRAAIKQANKRGFTINLSGNNLADADRLADAELGPVVAVLPAEVQGNVKLTTPAGRRVVVCPATYREDVTCQSCGLCAVLNRQVIVGFPAHGVSAKRADAIATAA